MKFKDKTTGNILSTSNKKAIELMKGQPSKYEAIAEEKPAKKAAKTE